MVKYIIFSAVSFVIGFLLAKLLSVTELGAVLHIVKGQEEKDIYRIVLILPFDELEKRDSIRMKIQKDS